MRLNSLAPTAIKFIGPLAFALVLFGSSPVRAQSDGSGALVLHGCPDTAVFPGRSDGLTYTVCADIVFTPSGDINATLHGALLDPATAPSQAVIVQDFPCTYGDQTTHDSQIVITPDGTVNGTAAFTPNNPSLLSHRSNRGRERSRPLPSR